MIAWMGSDDNVKSAQAILTHRLHMNSLASQGRYSSDSEKERELVGAAG